MAIELIHLRKEYAGITPLKDVNAVIQKGEIIYHRTFRHRKINSSQVYQPAGAPYLRKYPCRRRRYYAEKLRSAEAAAKDGNGISEF